MECPNGHSGSPPDSVFCVECGSPLRLRCPNCGASLESHFKFCNQCGHDLAYSVTAAETPPSVTNGTRPAAPPEATSPPQNTASISPLKGERRQATVLFSDLTGYTALNERLDPEEVEDLMRKLKVRAVELVEGHGGIVNQFVGDEVLALFGIPTAHEDDPVRAVRAALGLHQLARELSVEFEGKIGRPVRMHTGIESGLVVTSTGDARDGAIGVTGDTVNTGARLRALAKEDAILLGRGAQRMVSELFETEALEPVVVKGKADPITPHRLLGERSNRAGTALPFIGRKMEIRQLTAIMEGCLASGHGRAVYIRADAGVGKTRLVEEMETIAKAHEFACHKGRLLEFGMATGQDPIRALVASLLGISLGASGDVLHEAVEGALASGYVAEPELPFLFDLLDQPQPEALVTIYDAMDNRTRNKGKQATVCSMLRRISAQKPVLLRVEDLHWADALTLERLASIAALVADGPMLLIMTSRREGEKLDQVGRAASGGSSLTTIDLAPLRPEEAQELAGRFLDVTSQFAQRCIERAEGNPLFLVELLRNAEETDQGGVPGSVQSLVLARMDKLDLTDRDAIQAAAIFGQSFPLDGLQELLANPDYRCERLLDNHLVVQDGSDYLFAHALVQEAVYGTLLRSQRRKLHRKAADWLAARDLPLRAEHLDRAEAPEAPQAYLNAARDQASQFHYERALRLAQRGLELARESPARASLACFHGDLLRALGRNADAIEAYEKAELAAHDDAQRCRAWIGQAESMRMIDRVQEAMALLDKAQVPAEANHLAAELAQLHHLRGNLYFPQGEFERCLAEHDRALSWAREAGMQKAEARSLGGQGDALYLTGRMRTAHQRFRQCVELCHRHGLVEVEVSSMGMLGWTGIYLDPVHHFLEAGRNAAELAARVNQHRSESIARGLVAYIQIELEEYEDARDQINRGLSATRNSEAKRFEPLHLWGLGRIVHAKGDRAEASRLGEAALRICRETAMGYLGATILGFIARVAPDATSQRRALAEAEGLLAKGCVSHNHLFVRRDAIEACLQSADWDGVERHTAALEAYTLPEPLPWSDFFIARGRALAAHGWGRRDDELVDSLRRLCDEANRLVLKSAVPAIEQALHAT